MTIGPIQTTLEYHAQHIGGLAHVSELKAALPLQKQAKKIIASIRERGWAKVGELELDEYLALASIMGEVEEVDDIRIRDDAPVLAYSAKSIPLHNDGPEGSCIGLYCIEAQPEQSAGTWIVNVSNLPQALPKHVLEYLSRTTFTRGNGDFKKNFPVLQLRDKDFILYYTPWFFPTPASDDELKMYEEFLQYIEEQTRSTAFSVALEPGEALFFDNHHYLHGRGALAKESPRWLKRVWIDCNLALE